MFIVKPNCELEVRFNLDPRKNSGSIIKNLAYILKDRFDSVDSIEQSTVAISGKHRAVITYKGGKQTSKKWYTKTKIESQSHFSECGGYKISLTEELECKDPNVTTIDIFRHRVRGSINNVIPMWRLDITAIKNSNTVGAKADRIRFIPGDISDFFKDCPWSLADLIEVEFEYTGPEGIVNINDIIIDQMYRAILRDHVDYKSLDIIAKLADVTGSPYSTKISKPGIINTKLFNYLLPRAFEINVEQWKSITNGVSEFVIRTKINGERNLVYFHDNKVNIVTGVGIINNTGLDRIDPHNVGTWLLDTEYYNDHWYIISVLITPEGPLLQGKEIDRLTSIDRAIKVLGPSFKTCPWSIAGIGTSLKAAVTYHNEYSIDSDGLLLTPLPTIQSYWKLKVIKWKPEEHTTIDFLVIKCPDYLEGKKPFIADSPGDTLYLLTNGSKERPSKDDFSILNVIPRLKDYYSALFKPSNAPYQYVWSNDNPDLHGAIVELVLDKNTRKWKLYRIRKDKLSVIHGGLDLGNRDVVAQDIWKKIHIGFSLQDIYTETAVEYDYDTLDFMDYIQECKSMTIIGLTRLSVDQELDIKTKVNTVYCTVENTKCTWTPLTFPKVDALENSTDTVVIINYPKFGSRNHAKFMRSAISVTDNLLIIKGSFTSLGDPNFKLVSNNDKWTVYQKKSLDIDISDNPHLVGGSDLNFCYKFQRQKSKEISGFKQVLGEPTGLCERPLKGIALCILEFLTRESGPIVRVQAETKVINILREAFPERTFESDIEKYDLAVFTNFEKKLDLLPGTPWIMKLDFDQKGQMFEIPRGKFTLIPFSTVGDPTCIMIAGKMGPDIWHIQTSVFIEEMQFFHKAYRPSGFKYRTPSSGKDYCYDCKAEWYILTKFSRMQKITNAEIMAKLDKLDN